MPDCNPRLSPEGTHYIHTDDCETAIKLGLPRENYMTQTLGGLLEDLKTQKFDSFDDWVNTASRKLAHNMRDARLRQYYEAPERTEGAICFDRKGRVCYKGGCFMRARDDGSFPIHYIWPDQLKILVDSLTPIGDSAPR